MIKKIATKTVRTIGDSASEILVLGGVVLISYGAWLIYEAAGFIVGGVLLLAGGALLGRRDAQASE